MDTCLKQPFVVHPVAFTVTSDPIELLSVTMAGPYEGKKAKITWIVELGNHLPKFEDVFDEQTFYWTAFVFVISAFIVAYFLSRRFKISSCDF